MGKPKKKSLRRKPTIFRNINQELNNPPRKHNIAQKRSSKQPKSTPDNSENGKYDEEINIYKIGDPKEHLIKKMKFLIIVKKSKNTIKYKI